MINIMECYLHNPARILTTLILLNFFSGPCHAGATDGNPAFNGTWVVNDELSDDTDRQVEKAIKAAGGRPDSGDKRGKGRYKGGPVEQELYDHLAYDETLHFQYTTPEFHLVYADGFERVFYADGRGRVASASGSQSGERQDYAFASWDGNQLVVEARPRDGGRTTEIYTLENDGTQLRVELSLKPLSFGVPVEIVRVYIRGEQ